MRAVSSLFTVLRHCQLCEIIAAGALTGSCFWHETRGALSECTSRAPQGRASWSMPCQIGSCLHSCTLVASLVCSRSWTWWTTMAGKDRKACRVLAGCSQSPKYLVYATNVPLGPAVEHEVDITVFLSPRLLGRAALSLSFNHFRG